MTLPDQFEGIKNEKWFHRVFDMVTFSKKNEIKIANQIGNVAQAQQIMMEILIRLSVRDSKISDLVSESFDDIKKLTENDLRLAKKLKQLENSLLGIGKQTNIDELTDTERSVLGGILCCLMNKFEVVSDYQRIYANAILTYLDVEGQAIEVKKSIESLKDINSKKMILTCGMEYGFLNQFNFDYIEDIEDMLLDFDFGNKTMNRIKEMIEATYNLRGGDGFIDKYNFDESLAIEDEFTLEMNDDVFEHYKDAPEKIEMTEIEVNSILNIPQGETKIFKNNIIHLKNFINCVGNLIFENCIISYNESERSDEITLAEGAAIKFINCKIECMGVDTSYFIQAMRNNEIIIQSCELINCSFFLNLGVDQSKVPCESTVRIDDCKINSPYLNFLYNTHSRMNGILSNSLVKLSTFQSDIDESAQRASYGFIRGGFQNSFVIKECHIEGEDVVFSQDDVLYGTTNGKIIILENNAIIENCSFLNLNRCISDAEKILKCKFENCINVITGYGPSGKTQLVSECLFKDCASVITDGGKKKILACQFVGCKNQIIKSSIFGSFSVEFCEFINIAAHEEDHGILSWAYLHFERPDKSTSPSYVKKCSFNGVNMEQGFLIDGTSYKNKLTAVYVESCDFRNCKVSNKSGQLISVMDFYYNIFNKRVDYEAVSVRDCKGLENVNQESSHMENVSLKTLSSTGEMIGTKIKLSLM